MRIVGVTGGVDTHADTHVAAAVDDNGGLLGVESFPVSETGYEELLGWLVGFGPVAQVGVEGTGSWGVGLSRFLTDQDVMVVEIDRPNRQVRRKQGKSDPTDAVSAARVLRLLAKRHRDMARLRNKHCTRLHALLLELKAGGISSEITVTKANLLLEDVVVADEVTRHRVLIAGELVDDIARLDTALKASKKRVTTAAVSASGTSLCDITGIGPICAAIIIGYTGDVTRFPTKGHFATYNATAPIEASSGDRPRHRLNPRGNRKLNHAIHIAAVTQLRHDTKGRVFYDRKITEGKSSKDAIRALKRRISDVVYRHLIADTRRVRII